MTGVREAGSGSGLYSTSRAPGSWFLMPLADGSPHPQIRRAQAIWLRNRNWSGPFVRTSRMSLNQRRICHANV